MAAAGKWVTTPADSQWFLENYAKFLNDPDKNRAAGQVYGYVDTGGSGTEKFYKAPSDYTMGLSHKLNAQGQFLDYTGSQIAQGTPYTPTPQDIQGWFNQTNATSKVNPDGTITYTEVINGADPPAQATGTLRIARTVTDNTGIVSDDILCSSSLSYSPTYNVPYRSCETIR